VNATYRPSALNDAEDASRFERCVSCCETVTNETVPAAHTTTVTPAASVVTIALM
jgi:hypothetical protein